MPRYVIKLNILQRDLYVQIDLMSCQPYILERPSTAQTA